VDEEAHALGHGHRRRAWSCRGRRGQWWTLRRVLAVTVLWSASASVAAAMSFPSAARRPTPSAGAIPVVGRYSAMPPEKSNELRFRREEEDRGLFKAMNEVDAGRDRATPASVGHDGMKTSLLPQSLSLRATVREHQACSLTVVSNFPAETAGLLGIRLSQR
jgi:hypothetical protein